MAIEYNTKFVYPEKVYSDVYQVDNGIYNICGSAGVSLYSKEKFAAGVTLYTDYGLTTPINGYAYVTYAGAGNIFSLNISTGVVGSDLGFNCEGSYTYTGSFNNSSTTVCTVVISTYYTSAPLAVGVIIYSDAARTIPVTGSDFFLENTSGIIYSINNATGAIVSDSGVRCTASGNTYQYALTQSDVVASTPVKLYTKGVFEKGAIMYTDYAMTTALTGFNYISQSGSIDILTISKTTGEVGCAATSC